MFSVYHFAVLFIGAIAANDSNDFEIRHLIELGSKDLDETVNPDQIEKDVESELDRLICPGYTNKGAECSIDGKYTKWIRWFTDKLWSGPC